ncbi:hypothetical protein AURDEDRAFT_88100 [Auricularia subglabra TFB-10046 SS5]|uniref:Calmodulin n=1 Tax=Auricularia subglabra (strain TFB-10046 / SS5) TaxID=717982 RepID=J0WYZ6_AURST|nr:hypothetical protein AURDEDRAFT_88100 [Auricularia subglabra TFB-10046 SS5]
MSSPAQSPSSTKKRFSLGRTLSRHWSSSKSNLRDAAPLQDEKPLAILRVQVLGCKNLAAADRNGKSDPYVVVTFQRQRKKTPVMHKTLDPVYAKDATFDFPVYQSVVERLGTLLELVVWDKDLLGKDYLAELPLACASWFPSAEYDFASPKNHSFWRDLQSSRSKREARGAIHVKIGFVAPQGVGARSVDFGAIYGALSKQSRGDIFSTPATKGIGTLGDGSSVGRLNEDTDDEDSVSDSASARTLVKNLPSFRLNWEGTKIDYSFSQHKEIAGILLLEIKSASGLPKRKDLGTSGIECDPCVVVTFGKRTLRTRVIRHTLEPTWNERLILIVPKEYANSPISLSVLNWDTVTVSGDDTLGEATLDVSDLAASAPRPDEHTGLYPPEASISHGMRDFKLPLSIPKDSGLDAKSSPVLLVSAKFERHAAFRQRFWRAHLHEFDKDNSGTFSRRELSTFLLDSGIDLPPSKIDALFTQVGKDPRKDQMSVDEAVVALETLIGVPPASVPASEPGEGDSPVTHAQEPAAGPPPQPADPPAGPRPETDENPATPADPEARPPQPSQPPPQEPVSPPPSHLVASPDPVLVEEPVRGETSIPKPETPLSVSLPVQKEAPPSTGNEAPDANPGHATGAPAPVPGDDTSAPTPPSESSTQPPQTPKPDAEPVTKKKGSQPSNATPVPRRGITSAAEAELAAGYAALVLADAALEITAERLIAVLSAAGVHLEPFWADVFARGCANRDVKTMLLSVGGGAGQQGVASRPDATSHLEEHAEKREQVPSPAAPAEESDDDMGFGLFD